MATAVAAGAAAMVRVLMLGAHDAWTNLQKGGRDGVA